MSSKAVKAVKDAAKENTKPEMNLQVELELAERASLLGILPEKGDILTGLLVENVRKAVGFSEDEQEKLGMNTAGGMLQWDPEKTESGKKKFTFKERTVEVIRKPLKDLQEAGELLPQHIALYKKFIGTDIEGIDDEIVVEEA